MKSIFKKIMGLLSLIIITFVSFSCESSSSPSETETMESSSIPFYQLEPLVDENYSYHVSGSNECYYNKTWKNNMWDSTKENEMSPASLNDIRLLDSELFDSLLEKDLMCLYTKKIRFGVRDADFDTQALINDKLYEQDGSYAFKIVKSKYYKSNDDYYSMQYYPDPDVSYVENLTPTSLFIPQWSAKPDEYGFTWNSYPICIGEGGIYTVVFAAYFDDSNSKTPDYGFGLILDSIDSAALPHSEYVFHSNNTYSLTGTPSMWSTSFAILQQASKGSQFYEAYVDLKVDDIFVLLVNYAWAECYGYDSIANIEELEGLFTSSGDNIKCISEGKFKIVFDVITLELFIYPA